MVRYLDIDQDNEGRRELEVPLDEDSIENAKSTVIKTATAIRDRQFKFNSRKVKSGNESWCKDCDFLGFCGMDEAIVHKKKS